MHPHPLAFFSDTAVDRSDVQIQVLSQDDGTAHGGHSKGRVNDFTMLDSGHPTSPLSATNEALAEPRNFEVAEQGAFESRRRLLTSLKMSVFISCIPLSQEEGG